MCFITTSTAVCANPRISVLRVVARTSATTAKTRPWATRSRLAKAASKARSRAPAISAIQSRWPGSAGGQLHLQLAGRGDRLLVQPAVVGGERPAHLADPLIGGVGLRHVPGRDLPETGQPDPDEQVRVERGERTQEVSVASPAAAATPGPNGPADCAGVPGGPVGDRRGRRRCRPPADGEHHQRPGDQQADRPQPAADRSPTGRPGMRRVDRSPIRAGAGVFLRHATSGAGQDRHHDCGDIS